VYIDDMKIDAGLIQNRIVAIFDSLEENSNARLREYSIRADIVNEMLEL
jgi:hypothetical protein